MNSLTTLNPLNLPDWDDLLLATPGNSFFHSSAWAKVLSESYGYIPFYFAIVEGGKFQALVPVMEVNSALTGKRGVSLPFTDYCEPIIGDEVDAVGLFNGLIEFGKKRGWKYIEFRGGDKYFRSLEPRTSDLATDFSVSNLQPATRNEPFGSSPDSRNQQPGTSNGFSFSPAPVFIPFLGHTLDLTKGERVLHAGLRDSTRRNVKKAVSLGVDVKIFRDPEAIKEFYRLNCLTRREHGLPPQPYFFFRWVYHYIISKSLGFVTLASHAGRNIAGAVFFYLGDRAIYKYGASDKKYQDLRANNLVMWESIRRFASRGFRSFCFGRTELENEGLKQFKAGWGAEEKTINYYKYALGEGRFVNSRRTGLKWNNMILGKIPIPVLKFIGGLAYKHMG